MATVAGTTPFELTGGALCLDFANTARHHGREREEVRSYGDLVAFGVQTGVLTEGDARRLRREASRDPRAAERALERARALRAAVYHAFAAIAAGHRVVPEHLATINDAVADSVRSFRLVSGKDGFAWALVSGAGAADLDLPRAAVARSAADLLTSGDLPAVRECALDVCAWLFLDRSKNQKRRWCDMKTCGNRSKARRHYERSRATRKP
jgi:predicted RNA-binding Zn ribbon-like protein